MSEREAQRLGRVRLGYSGIRIYSGIYSSYSAPGNRIAGMEIPEWKFRNENSSQTNVYSHYSNYSYSGLIPNERALILVGIQTLKCALIPCALISRIYGSNFGANSRSRDQQ